MGLLAELKSATRDVHGRVETGLDLQRRVHDWASYTRFLVGLHSVYAPLERSVSACTATRVAIPDWDSREKTQWLAEDLRDLGVACAPETDIRVAGVEDVLGSVYVMEGATLGGAVILHEMGGLGVSPPHRFFFGYGALRAAMWSAFRTQVAAIEATDLDRPLVVEAAERTFRAVEHACLGPQ